jgi:hypothetical protein
MRLFWLLNLDYQVFRLKMYKGDIKNIAKVHGFSRKLALS